MKRKLTQEELRQMVVNSVRENGFNEVFTDAHINEIVNGIINDYKVDKERGEVPQEISESPTFTAANTAPIASVSNKMPSEEEILGTVAVEEPRQDIDMKIGMEAGAEPTEQMSEPTMYRPELPHELQEREPAEFIIWDYNDISVGGENLSNKPFGKLDNPEEKASMMDVWKNEGKSRAKVYVAKFEELGEISFDYVSGQSTFIEKGTQEPVDASVNTFNPNPYAGTAQGQVDNISTETDLTKTLESQVDVQATLEKVLKDLVMKGLDRSMGAEEEAISMNPPVNVTTAPMPVNEAEADNNPSVCSKHEDYDPHCEVCNPSCMDESEEIEIVGINEMMNPYGQYMKVQTPSDLAQQLSEGVNHGYRERVGNGVRQYCKEGVCFYMPEEPVSVLSSYVKK